MLGLRTRYDGKSKKEKFERNDKDILIPVCPEQLGGLPTPREPADIVYTSSGKKAITRKSKYDVTENFLRGAKETLKLCELLNIKKAILKSKSPSCGRNGFTYNLLKNNDINCIIKN